MSAAPFFTPERAARISRYLVSGAAGLAVNICLYALFVYGLRVPYLLAAIAAYLLALAASFVLVSLGCFAAIRRPA